MIRHARQLCLRSLMTGCLVIIACSRPPVVAEAIAELRIASWNLNNLHYLENEALRKDAPERSAEDLDTLRRYVARLDADIVALQEVNGPDAAALLFPKSHYEVYFSARYAQDRDQDSETDHIYTGFAVRRGVFDRVQAVDRAELSVLTPSGRPVRHGLELLVERDGKTLALLNVHLKSGCFARSLEPARTPACDTLARQRAPLERWIDQTFESAVPFVVLGDFNRAFDVHGARDHLWEEINDGSPAGLDLHRLPFRREPACWAGTRAHHDHPIDFFVFGPRAWKLVDPDSFTELVFEAKDANPGRGTPSDHCPIAVTLDWGQD